MSGRLGEDTEEFENPLKTQPKAEKKYYLLVVQGVEVGNHVEVQGQIRLGRGTDMELCLRDQRISNEHCRVFVEDDIVYVEDCASTNGTFVNDEMIRERTILVPDDILQVGHTVLRLAYRTSMDMQRETDLYEAATTDFLTAIPNRHSFLSRARQEIAYAMRHHLPCSLLLIDADHFKEVNDTFGHPAGDHVLHEMGAIFREETRIEDLLARFGGEEFIFLLRNTKGDEAAIFAERIREHFEDTGVLYNGVQIPLTISAGICCNPDGESLDLDALIRCADKALYDAKHEGRNCVRERPYREAE